jgi:hypothetical protein
MSAEYRLKSTGYLALRNPMLVVVASLSLTAGALRAQSPSVELMGELPPVLRESSGVAVSRQNDGVLWTHNDSDNDPVLYAVDITGELLGTFALESAVVSDWEDMSLGPCIEDPAVHCLYVADTGDNMMQRTSYTIYIVAEPIVSRGIGVDPATVGPVRRMEFRYADTAHDAEGLAVAPDGDLYIVTKGWHGLAHLYVIIRDAIVQAVQRGDTITAAVVENIVIETGGSLPMLITGAAFSPSGGTLVARSYVELHFFNRRDVAELLTPGRTCVLGYREPQGEAVDFLDESTLVLTSESLYGRPGTIHRVRCEN